MFVLSQGPRAAFHTNMTDVAQFRRLCTARGLYLTVLNRLCSGFGRVHLLIQGFYGAHCLLESVTASLTTASILLPVLTRIPAVRPNTTACVLTQQVSLCRYQYMRPPGCL
jgi:hypothetical protein